MNAPVLAIAAAALLTACVTQPVREALPPAQSAAAEARQIAREDALQRQPAWSLQGRIAVSNGRNGGSGRIDWIQQGRQYDVSLSAPVTRQSWRLVGDASAARLEGLEVVARPRLTSSRRRTPSLRPNKRPSTYTSAPLVSP